MMNFRATVGLVLAISALLVALSGCRQHEGVAEPAGKDIDRVVEGVGQ